MPIKCTSIPMVLAKQFDNNGSEMARVTGLSEITIGKYRNDRKCEFHMIIDGELFTHHKANKAFEVAAHVPEVRERG